MYFLHDIIFNIFWRNFSGVLFAYLIKEDVQNVILLFALRPWRCSATALLIILWLSTAVHIPDYIPPTLWPPNSPDLNPVDYKVLSVVQEQVNDLRQRSLGVWVAVDKRIIYTGEHNFCWLRSQTCFWLTFGLWIRICPRVFSITSSFWPTEYPFLL